MFVDFRSVKGLRFVFRHVLGLELREDLIDEPVFRGFLGGHVEIAVGVLGDAFDRLAGMGREDLR